MSLWVLCRTCLYVLGLISKTRQGCDMLKQQGWDAVRHNRSMLWPIVPEELEPQSRPNLLSSVPSTLRLTGSTGLGHNSEGDSLQSSKPKLSYKVFFFFTCCNFIVRNAAVLLAGLCILDDDRLEVCDFSEESSLYVHPKLMRDQGPFSMLASCRFRNRLLTHSLSLLGKKPHSISYCKGSSQIQGRVLDEKHGLKCTVAEPNSFSIAAADVFPIYNSHPSKSPPGNGEASFGLNEGVEHLTDNGPSGGNGTKFKSRSRSFNTDTTTSGVSSLSSSPSRETLPSTLDTDCASLNTVINTQTTQEVHSMTPQPCNKPLSIPKSCTASLVPPGSFHTLPRRAQSLKSPSVTTLSGLADCSMYCSSIHAFGHATLKYSSSHNGCTSPRDALGYATLRRLQHQRIQSSLSHSEALASSAKDIFFTDAINMNTSGLDSRLTSQRYLCCLRCLIRCFNIF